MQGFYVSACCSQMLLLFNVHVLSSDDHDDDGDDNDNDNVTIIPVMVIKFFI